MKNVIELTWSNWNIIEIFGEPRYRFTHCLVNRVPSFVRMNIKTDLLIFRIKRGFKTKPNKFVIVTDNGKRGFLHIGCFGVFVFRFAKRKHSLS